MNYVAIFLHLYFTDSFSIDHLCKSVRHLAAENWGSKMWGDFPEEIGGGIHSENKLLKTGYKDVQKSRREVRAQGFKPRLGPPASTPLTPT